MRRDLVFLFAGSVCLAGLSSRAFAQSEPVYTAPPPTNQPPAANQPPPVVAAPPVEKDYFPRFRWGIWAIGGPYFYAGSGGGVGGVNVRLGVQINEMFGVYGQPIGILGGGASVSAGGAASASAVVVGGFSGMADLTLGNLFFIAAGPELLAGAAGAARAASGMTKAQGAEGVFFSIAGRMGLALGNTHDPKQRRAFTFGLDFHLILTPTDPVIAPMIGLGYDQF